MDTIGARIKQIRKDKGLTQVELGELLGISGAGVSYIESGGSQPTEAAIKLICATYNVNYQWLTQGKEPVYLYEENDELLNKYAPLANDMIQNLFRKLVTMPSDGWETVRDYVQYMLDAVDRARDSHSSDKES